MLKEISEAYQIVSSASVVGAVTFTSSSSSVKYKDSVAYQVNWTGSPVGVININGSIDYNPGTPQSAGAQNSGLFTTIISQTIGSGSQAPVLFNLNQLSMPWTQIQFVASGSSSGLLGVWFAAKSLG